MTPTSEVIRLAREAGFDSSYITPSGLEYVLAITESDEVNIFDQVSRLISLAKAEEREAILQIVQKTCTPDATMRGDGYNQAAVEIEALIIARTKEAQ